MMAAPDVFHRDEQREHALVALSSAADQRLLIQRLADAGVTAEPVGAADGTLATTDLVIVDPPAWRRWAEQLCSAKASEEPAILPILLLIGSNEGSSEWIHRELGRGVDDVLQLPTSTAALEARVRNLLRLRALSRTQAHDHRLTRQALDGVSRALHTLHACNETMLREDSEAGLLESVCEIITQSEGYALAWAGFAQNDATGAACIVKQCVAGPAAEYARAVDIRLDDSPEGQGPGARAIATRSTQIVSDVANEPSMQPWRESLLAWGLGAVIVLPLRVSQGPAGALAVYSEKAGDFKTEERMLLERLADNLAYGVDRLRMQEEQENQREEIRKLAYQDPLTGLPNRRSLIEGLERIVDHAEDEQIAAILFIDLNDFKLINDALGHAAGDEVLRSTAQRLRRTVRASDLVARQGGDEFIVVMVDNPRHPRPTEQDAQEQLTRAAQATADRILSTLKRPFEVDGYAHRLSASVGISLLPFLGEEPETVLDQADMAMYAAKQTEQRITFYSTDIGSRRQERLSIEAKLHRALEVGQFRLHYQPLWELATGRIVAVEALLRWQDDAGQFISPGKFIPVAEEIGLLGPISEWVISEAAQQVEQWRRAGLRLTMGVNLSVTQLQGGAAARRIIDQISALGSHPEWWVLELTEETVMRSPEDVSEAMAVLSNAGFRLALDDFGRGYSSLARLQAMPLDALKVDKLFVDGLESNEVSGRLVRAVVELARQLSLRIVAEGIETPEQQRLLAAMGCNFGQGFLVSPAVPPAEIPGLVARYDPATRESLP